MPLLVALLFIGAAYLLGRLHEAYVLRAKWEELEYMILTHREERKQWHDTHFPTS